jgi:polysaccharide pyruvyl transferase WcaK-like protein
MDNNDSMAQVVVINQHSVNVGDEAAGYALLQRLSDSFRVGRIDIIYNGSAPIPSPTSSKEIIHHDFQLSLKKMGFLGIAVFLISGIKINNAIREFKETVEASDFVIVAPGGANIGIYRDWRYLTRLLLVRKIGKEPIFHWNTIGSSGDRVFDFLASKVLRDSKLYVREKKSYEYLESLGLECELGPDTAFFLDPISAQHDQGYIAFVPSELDSWHPNFKNRPINQFVLDEYVPAIGSFANKFDYAIKIIPHLRNATEKQFNEKVANVLRDMGCTVIADIKIDDFRDYDAALANSSLVVGMRYHTAVLAAKNHRPFIALAYENKALEVGRYTRMERYCIDLSGDLASGSTLFALLQELNENKTEISSALKTVCEESLYPRVSYVLDTEMSDYKFI